MNVRLLRGAVFAALALVPAMAFAQAETEPNDSKATANLFTLPALSTTGVITGNSISATTTGLDYFRVTTSAQATAGFYRHRLIAQSTTPGHTLTVRGLTQTGGVPNAGTDAAFATSSAATVPPRFVQWYTSQAPGEIFIRVTGAAATTANYSLDYDVQPVTEVTGPGAVTQGTITITAAGQGHTTDTDLWVYDSTRTAIPGYGNDDTAVNAQSVLTRDYLPGDFHLAISNFNLANNLGSPPDDAFLTGAVLDFPGVVADSSTATNLNLAHSIGGTAVAATKVGPFDVVFVAFTVVVPVELTGFTIE